MERGADIVSSEIVMGLGVLYKGSASGSVRSAICSHEGVKRSGSVDRADALMGLFLCYLHLKL